VNIPRVNVLGVGVSVLNLDRARAALQAAVREGRRGYVCVTTVHCIIAARHDPALRAVYNRSLLTTPDGMPLVWAGKLAGHRDMGRVYGPDLMLDTFRWTEQTGHSHFLFGGRPGVAEELRARLLERFPKVRIVGTYTDRADGAFAFSVRGPSGRGRGIASAVAGTLSQGPHRGYLHAPVPAAGRGGRA